MMADRGRCRTIAAREGTKMSGTITTAAAHAEHSRHRINRAVAGTDDVERLSAKFHLIYQEEARRQGSVEREEIYEELDESVREFYRAQARYVLDHYVRR
jgi:hypothetical protein